MIGNKLSKAIKKWPGGLDGAKTTIGACYLIQAALMRPLMASSLIAGAWLLLSLTYGAYIAMAQNSEGS